MVEAGIMDGDLAIIRRSETAENGQIVVALVDDSEATLKVFEKKDDEICLKPCNSCYPIQHYTPSQVKIQGILNGIIRKY